MAVAVANSSEISRVRAPNVGTPSSLRRSLIARESEMASWRSSSMSTPAGSASILLRLEERAAALGHTRRRRGGST